MRWHNKYFTSISSPPSALTTRIILILLLVLRQTVFVLSTSQPCGSINCENGGKCLDLSITSTASISKIQASGSLLLQCLCPPGYGGVTCSYYHGKLCGGDTTCHFGSCASNSLNPNVTECPCDVAYSISEFAGQMCENPVTEYCYPVWSHEPSQQFFCTNGGRCFGGGIQSSLISEESDTWGMVMSDTPIICQCRKSL
jgi:hypothetical protein